jgi:hypothetical protein
MLINESLEPDVAELHGVFFDEDDSGAHTVKDIVQLLLLVFVRQDDLVDVEDIDFMDRKLDGVHYYPCCEHYYVLWYHFPRAESICLVSIIIISVESAEY